MESRSYTERLSNDPEPVYLSPDGSFHRASCSHYIAPGENSVMVEGPFRRQFLDAYCRLCFPTGVEDATRSVRRRKKKRGGAGDRPRKLSKEQLIAIVTVVVFAVFLVMQMAK